MLPSVATDIGTLVYGGKRIEPAYKISVPFSKGSQLFFGFSFLFALIRFKISLGLKLV